MYFLNSEYDTDDHKKMVEKWGRYNAFPPGWREVTSPAEIRKIEDRLLFIDWSATESRQMYPLKEDRFGLDFMKPMVMAQLFFSDRGSNGDHKGGFAISSIWKADGPVRRYYVFGCQHNNCRSEILGMHCNRTTCQDCGYSWTIDSSG